MSYEHERFIWRDLDSRGLGQCGRGLRVRLLALEHLGTGELVCLNPTELSNSAVCSSSIVLAAEILWEAEGDVRHCGSWPCVDNMGTASKQSRKALIPHWLNPTLQGVTPFDQRAVRSIPKGTSTSGSQRCPPADLDDLRSRTSMPCHS